MPPYWKTVEEALRCGDEEGNGFRQSKVIQRVALNFGLLMTYYWCFAKWSPLALK